MEDLQAAPDSRQSVALPDHQVAQDFHQVDSALILNQAEMDSVLQEISEVSEDLQEVPQEMDLEVLQEVSEDLQEVHQAISVAEDKDSVDKEDSVDQEVQVVMLHKDKPKSLISLEAHQAVAAMSFIRT